MGIALGAGKKRAEIASCLDQEIAGSIEQERRRNVGRLLVDNDLFGNDVAASNHAGDIAGVVVLAEEVRVEDVAAGFKLRRLR
jgi:hypothetical protein